jgi:hypothetical protein
MARKSYEETLQKEMAEKPSELTKKKMRFARKLEGSAGLSHAE